MIAATVASSLPTPISVPMSALPMSETALHDIGSPLRRAPSPLIAVNVSRRMGLRTTPSAGVLPTVRPMDTHENGHPCTKFVVPSSGSTYHVGLSVIGGMTPSAAATDSSPTRTCEGNAAASFAKMMSSHFLSVAVTRSTAPLYSTSLSACHASRISAPAASAASSATSRHFA